MFPDRDHFGRIFYNQAQIVAAGIPQIAVVMGSCTAGGAYVPAMSDETVIVKEQGHDFPRRPAAGESGDRRSRQCRGAGRRATCIRRSPAWPTISRKTMRMRSAIARNIVANLNRVKQCRVAMPRTGRAALRSGDIYGIDSAADARKPFDIREIIARIVDGIANSTNSRRATARRWSAASRHLYGYPGRHHRQQRHPVFARSALKGAHFIELVHSAQHPARLPAEHHRLHGRQEIRERAASPRTAPRW